MFEKGAIKMDSLGLHPQDEEQGVDAGARAAPRVNLVIRPAKLVSAQGEFVCVIRDVSETGVGLRTFHRLPSCRRLALELQTGDRHEMERVWERGDEAGFSFLEDCDIDGLVLEIGRFPKRRLRLQIALPIRVSTITGKAEGLIENLSQQGAMIACDASYARDQIVRLSAPELPEIAAKVRWRKEQQYGLVFENTFGLRDFAVLAASLQAPGLLTDRA